MVTITCTNDECSSNGVDINFGGDPVFVECGGCGAHLTPRDHRDDPEPPQITLGVTTG